jgi:aldose 1-epimerase
VEPPSGVQFEIALGDQRATVVEVGGGVRAYSVGGRDVLDPYPADAMCDGAHGTPLIPWPNRIEDGHYEFDGVEHHLALTEPARRNASHGLVRWRRWKLIEHEPARVVLEAPLAPMPGYPFALSVELAYALTPDGLAVTARATNTGDRACPYGFGHHPYLSPGEGLVDDCTLEFGAATELTTDERMLPIGAEPVAGTPYDFNAARRVGDVAFDRAFTDLARDPDGRAHVRLTGPDGRTVELWADASCKVIQLYTGDTLAPHRRRRGLASEPMTCPANAFRSGDDQIRIEPGETVATRWGVGLF